LPSPRRDPLHNCSVRRRGDRRWESAPRRSRAWRTTVQCDTRSEATARVPRRSARRGTGGPWLEAVGKRPARTPRGAVAGARRAAQPGWQNARRASGALEHGQAVFQPVNASLTAFFSKKLNRSAQSGE
jgi:hypothetical protein